MSDAETLRRQQEQRRAIDIHRPNGAVITHSYLERKQELIAVNRNDLEDILTFDGLQSGLSSLGLFLLPGALWLGLDKVLGMQVFILTPMVAVCACSVVMGAILLLVGLLMGRKKRDKITRIFRETRSLPLKAN